MHLEPKRLVLRAMAIFLVAVAVGLVALSPGAFGASPAKAAVLSCTVQDNFDRPDSSNMGPNWTEQAADFSIFGNQAGGGSLSLMTFNGANSADGACVDAIYGASAGTRYVALILDYESVYNNIFIKVQDNGGSGSFNSIAFYGGNNSGGCAPLTALTASFTSARLFAHKNGDTAILDIDTDFNGTADQTYQCTYTPTGGSGVGVGVYGAARLDNFGNLVPPTPLQSVTTLKTTVLTSGALLGLPAKLATYLKSAESYLAIGSPTMKAAACQQLVLFKSAVTAAMRQDSVVLAQGATWIAQANAIRAAIPCAGVVVVVT